MILAAARTGAPTGSEGHRAANTGGGQKRRAGGGGVDRCAGARGADAQARESHAGGAGDAQARACTRTPTNANTDTCAEGQPAANRSPAADGQTRAAGERRLTAVQTDIQIAVRPECNPEVGPIEPS